MLPLRPWAAVLAWAGHLVCGGLTCAVAGLRTDRAPIGLQDDDGRPLPAVDACAIECRPCIVEECDVNVMSIAGSAMRAASLGVQAAASNVARLPVADATRVGVAQASVGGGGVDAGRVEVAADPAAPVADLLAAKDAVLAFRANATVIRRSDSMLGALLDARA